VGSLGRDNLKKGMTKLGHVRTLASMSWYMPVGMTAPSLEALDGERWYIVHSLVMSLAKFCASLTRSIMLLSG
jgi:hypothetical protein